MIMWKQVDEKQGKYSEDIEEWPEGVEKKEKYVIQKKWRKNIYVKKYGKCSH